MEAPEKLEEECGNAVFEISNARECYSKRCTEELGKCLSLQNDIAMETVVLRSSPQNFEIPATPATQGTGTLKGRTGTPRNRDNGAERLQTMINKIQELKVALKQVENNRNFEIKHYLK